MDKLKEKEVQFDWEKRTGFYVDSKLLKECVAYINKNKIEYLILNEMFGYKKADCDFLCDTPHVKKLDVVNREIDLKGILCLEQLDDLYLNVGKKQTVDFSGFKHLKKLNFEYFKGMEALSFCTRLAHVIVRKADASFLDIDIFKAYPDLVHLEIVQADIPKSLNFLKYNESLTELEFHHCKSVIDLEALALLKDRLEVLKITFCKKMTHADVIAKLRSLKWLTFSDAATLESAEIVAGLTKLKTLIVRGSSMFEDGDLTMLKDQYDHFVVDKKKHYIYPAWYQGKK